MDKFAIPNKIINGIVIVDGTSETAARKARHEATIASHKLTYPSGMTPFHIKFFLFSLF